MSLNCLNFDYVCGPNLEHIQANDTVTEFYLDTLRWEALPQLIEDAYRLVAPKRLIAELDS